MKGYRTLALNLVTALFGVLTTTDWLGLGIDGQTAGLIITGLGLGNTVLRFFTDTPVGQK